MTPTTKSLPVREIPQRHIEEVHTFAEEMGQPPFDWNAFLARTDQTDSEWDAAYTLASSWVTCACGNMCAVLPRNVIGCPEDVYLAALGCEFACRIAFRNIKAARETLAAIELRSAALLAQGKGAQS